MIRPFALVITGLRSGRVVSTTSAVLWERSCDEQTTSAACQDMPHSSEAGRDFITLLGGAVATWPLIARAQQTIKKIGFLSVSSPAAHASFVAAFNEGLKEAGFVEGQNLAIVYSWAEGRFDRLPALAADLIQDNVDVIAATSGDVSIRKSQVNLSSTITKSAKRS